MYKVEVGVSKDKRMEVEVGEGVKCCKGGGGALTVG